MFNWICPQCGAEVPPSYNSCPNCAAKEAAPAAAAPAAEPPPVPQAPAPGVRKAFAPAAAAAPPRGGFPGWLVAVLVAMVLVGLGAAGYFYLLPSSRARQAPAEPGPAPLETVAAAPAAGARVHPLAKYIEITGFRIIEDARKNVQVKYIVVNHSNAELSELAMDLALRPSTAKPEDQPIASFSVKVPALLPYESREITSTARTQLRAYELPDWQFLRAEFRITSPPAE